MALDLTTARASDAVHVQLSGELDISETARVERELRTVDATRPERVVLDLRGLSFMDSSGLRLIVSAYRRLAEDGRRLQIVQGPPPIRRIFEVTRLDGRLEFIDAPAG